MEACTSSPEGTASTTPLNPQTALLDVFFPGISVLFNAVQKHLKIDLYLYIPIFLVIGATVYSFQYTSDYIWSLLESFFMSTADIRIDDEMYNFVMAWVATQNFARHSRRFVANTNLNSRSWYLYADSIWGDNEEYEEDEQVYTRGQKKKKGLQYTPSFGTHYFWWKGNLFLFKRTQNSQQQSFVPASEREEISICGFGRNPTALKALLEECRSTFQKNDMNKTVIYRGALKAGSAEPQWIRAMSRVSRPFSTVVLDESVKQSLLDDMQDYLDPATRRWYSNRGIPYRRGYLLYGPPGTGKSSLSFAIAGYFQLKIYIVSLNSPSMNEENLGSLFGELPKQCVVLLEDIDTAGLTHTREIPQKPAEPDNDPSKPGQSTEPRQPIEAVRKEEPSGRLSLSALLNIIDGVASQEGRVLVMTTNHIEKLDKALIRPGRVDMMVKFNLADSTMIATIFKAIFATIDADSPRVKKRSAAIGSEENHTCAVQSEGVQAKHSELDNGSIVAQEDDDAAAAQKILDAKKAEELRISTLADAFAKAIPTHSFSPAEIQGYLLKYKRDPEEAVVNAAEWVRTVEAERSQAEADKIRLEAEKAKAEAEKKDKDYAEKAKLEAEKKEKALQVNGHSTNETDISEHNLT